MAVRVAPRRAPRERDLTSGSLGRLLLDLALPSALEMALFSVVGVAHAYWLGRVGGMALAAVAMGTSLRMVLISPIMGLSAGGMAVVARHVGAGERRLADHAVMQSLLLLFVLVAAVIAIGLSLMPMFLRWMGASGEVLTGAIAYLRIIFIGLLFVEMLPSMSGVIRGAGHPEHTLRINMVYVAVMLALTPILVLGLGPFPALGVRGVAWAEVLGSAAAVAALLLVLVRGWAGVTLHLADVRPDLSVWRRILKVALPTSAQRLSPNLGNAFLMRLVTSFGGETLTAYSLLTRVFGVLQSVMMGIGNATAPLVGQNLGAQKPDRSEASAKLGTVYAVCSALVLGGLLSIAPGRVFGAFGLQGEALSVAVMATWILTLSSAALAWMDVIGRALAGAGDALSPMFASIGALWLVQLPAAAILSSAAGLGPTGIFVGLVLSYLAGGLALTLRFRQGRWKYIQL